MVEARPATAAVSPYRLQEYLDYLRPDVVWLDRPIETGPLGLYKVLLYATVQGRVAVSTSLRALCELLGTVTLNPIALPELVTFGLVHRDETLFTEIRAIPAGCTLYPDGSLSPPQRLVKRAAIRTLADAVDRLHEALGRIFAEFEEAADCHLCGLSSGLDTRILAAFPKRRPDAWHWLNVAYPKSGERRGADHFAEFFGLKRYTPVDWTPEAYYDGQALYRAVDLSNGMLSVGECGRWQYHFEQYAQRQALPRPTMVWSGMFGDGLIGPTYVRDAPIVWRALKSPHMGHLATIFRPAVMEPFDAQQEYYFSNPFCIECADAKSTCYLIVLLTRGRRYLNQIVSQFHAVGKDVVLPFAHPAIVQVALDIDCDYYAKDAVRVGLLERLKPGAAVPNFKGFGGPSRWPAVVRCMQREFAKSEPARWIVRRPLLRAILAGKPPQSLPATFGAKGPKVQAKRFVLGALSRIPGCSDWRLTEWLRDSSHIPGEQSLLSYDRLLAAVVYLNLLTERNVRIKTG